MANPYQTELFKDLYRDVRQIRIVDCHEHLQPEGDLPSAGQAHIGRFFAQYASSDLISAGMPAADMQLVRDGANGLNAQSRWALLKPWYRRAWHTAYCECLRIALRDLYDCEDFSDETVDSLTDAMRRRIQPGFTRTVLDRAGIDFAMNQTAGSRKIYETGFDHECFIVDMIDGFTRFPLADLQAESGLPIRCLDEYLRVIDAYFAKYAGIAGAFKVPRAYDRSLYWADVTRAAAEGPFNRLLAFNDGLDGCERQALENFIMHYLCRACGDAGLRMKFHTGLQEGNGNHITNSRAALLANLFLKYPQTSFDIYHLSYPYQEEVVTLVKNFPNVSVDFCWMWIINPAAARRALADLLDAVPLNKIHGFGGDFVFVEGSYGHAEIARREITRVLCDKIEEGRFSEDQARTAARMLLRDNALENFGLLERRAAAVAAATV